VCILSLSHYRYKGRKPAVYLDAGTPEDPSLLLFKASAKRKSLKKAGRRKKMVDGLRSLKEINEEIIESLQSKRQEAIHNPFDMDKEPQQWAEWEQWVDYNFDLDGNPRY
jgi:hypothetical protein